jgi:rSAM/selenodomain-associated transferase 1
VTKNLFGLLAKYPEAGKVKTRLAQEVGARNAASIYKAIAERVFIETSPDGGSGFERTVFYAPSEDGSRFESWMPGETLHAQRGGDIGEIMSNALKDLFEAGAIRAVITGADIPGLNREIIKEAFLRLDDADVVIGPAEDGGYYLIGMKAEYPEIFRGISWSTGKVFDETLRIIEKMGLTYLTVRVLSDLDRIGDIAKIKDLRFDPPLSL